MFLLKKREKMYVFIWRSIQSVGLLEAGRPVHSRTNSTYLGRILAMQQLRAKNNDSHVHHHLQ